MVVVVASVLAIGGVGLAAEHGHDSSSGTDPGPAITHSQPGDTSYSTGSYTTYSTGSDASGTAGDSQQSGQDSADENEMYDNMMNQQYNDTVQNMNAEDGCGDGSWSDDGC